MNEVIKEYTTAYQAYLAATQDEMSAKLLVKSTRYRFIKARDELKEKERELLTQ